MKIDFQKLKEEVSLTKAAEYHELELTRDGKAFRRCCPICDSDDRGMVITPGKGFYCFKAKRGGDVIAMVAHVKEIGQREAAELLMEMFPSREVPRRGNSRDRQHKPQSNAATRLIHRDQRKPVNDNVVEFRAADHPEDDWTC